MQESVTITPPEKKSFFLAFGLILVIFFNYAVPYCGLLAGISINRADFPLGVGFAFLVFCLSTRSVLTFAVQLRLLALITGIIIISGILSCWILDTSWDGQWYHQVAILKLMEGWNPVHDPFYTLSRYDLTNHTSIEHFPKFSWISAASVAQFTGFIETGKLINHLVAWAAFFNCYYVLSRFINKRSWNMAISLLVVLNPVMVTQLFSDYVDGILSVLLLLILLQLVSIDTTTEFRKFKWGILGCSIIFISNLKFTGLALSGLIVFIFYASWLLRRFPLKKLLKRAAALTVFFIMAIFLFGYNPYLTNFRSKKDIFFPVKKLAYYRNSMPDMPRELRGKNNVEKLFNSLVSESNNDITTVKLNWKDPFSIHEPEIRLFSTTEVRLGGFGPLFQLSLWFSSLIFILGLAVYKRKFITSTGIILAACILVSTLISPVCWWARLSPQFYFFPFLILIPGLTDKDSFWGKFINICARVTIIVLLLNLFLIGGANFSANVIKTQMIRQEMGELRKYPQPVKFDFLHTPFQASRRRLREAGVKFIPVDTLTGKTGELQTLYKEDGYGPKFGIQGNTDPRR